MRPCDARAASATRRDLLAGGPIEVGSQPVELHARSAPERRHSRRGADESMPTQWGKLADRDPIPGHNEGFALVKLAHNLAAVIAEFTLGDLSGHTPTVARVLHRTHVADDLKWTGSHDTGGRVDGVGSNASWVCDGLVGLAEEVTPVVQRGRPGVCDSLAAQHLSSRTWVGYRHVDDARDRRSPVAIV